MHLAKLASKPSPSPSRGEGLLLSYAKCIVLKKFIAPLRYWFIDFQENK